MRRRWIARMGAAGIAAARLTYPLAALAAAPSSEAILPGSQPPEIVLELGLTNQDPLVGLMHSQECTSCHRPDISRTWRGSMMAHASRDPLMWAALAVAERGLPGVGVGDTCIRCHVPKGWLEGRSVPSDGSALMASDADGVTCHLCHRLTNPDDSELGVTGEQDPSFAARGHACVTGNPQAGVACDPLSQDGAPCGSADACQPEAFRGNAMIALFQNDSQTGSIARLGPYATLAVAEPPHAWAPSTFQRDAALCGSCHDVSNPVTGDLAPEHGRLFSPLPGGAFSGIPDDTEVRDKAGARNPPYAYGTEQRTYSEWFASAWRSTLVSSFAALPDDLQVAGGIVKSVSDAAAVAGGNYADGTPRGFTCQSCHMRPVTGVGSTQSAAFPPRTDLPRHDLTGANTWVPHAIQYLSDQGRLRIGGDILGQPVKNDLNDAAARAQAMLVSAASLVFAGPSALPDSVRVVNLSGHKLFTGYPEGRRMWIHVKWYGPGDALVREDGCYGPLASQDPLAPASVDTLLPPGGSCGPSPRVYEVVRGISKAWAQTLIGDMNVPADLPIRFDRVTGSIAETLQDVAMAEDANYVAPSFHLALNDRTVSDNRIPPYGMEYDEARKRNAVPVPACLYTDCAAPGDEPLPGSQYEHFEDVALSAPVGAVRAEVSLLYQTTSWEYVQFLWKTNPHTGALANVGDDLLAAWLYEDPDPIRITRMAPPVVMAAPEAAAIETCAAAAATLALLRRCTRRRTSR